MTSNKPPPVPPANRSNKGTGDDKAAPTDLSKQAKAADNPGQKGQPGNIRQNTTNQGYQQDR